MPFPFYRVSPGEDVHGFLLHPHKNSLIIGGRIVKGFLKTAVHHKWIDNLRKIGNMRADTKKKLMVNNLFSE
jgi:hypothetical protein